MRRRTCVAVYAVSLWLGACHADDRTGLFATIRWSGISVDQLEIGVDAAGGSSLVAPTRRPAQAGATLASPQTVAIYLAGALDGTPVTCTVSALAAGAQLGAAASATVTVSRGQLAAIELDIESGPKVNGQGCTDGSECDSTLCVDGVCCAQTCDGLCQACNVTGKEGICMPVSAGTRDLGCAEQGAPSCGFDGTCDGSGGCRRYPAGVACATAQCQTSTLVAAAACDGQGTCVTPPSISCAPYLCKVSGGAPLCPTTCVSDNDCAGASCVNGSCGPKPKSASGAGCGAATDCVSGICQDGVCCAAACTGACMSCNADMPGVCRPVATGKLDPHGICKDVGVTACGQNGLCDGAGNCALYPMGAMCAAGSCSGGHFVRSNKQCDGQGACVAAPDIDCAPYRCDPATTTCFTSCSANAQCATGQGFACGDGGVCQ